MPLHRWVLLGILSCGFALRCCGISFGLPDLYHADEPIVVNHAMAYGTGDLHPHFFQIPPLVSYILFGFYGVYFVLGWVLGHFTSPDDFADLFLTDPTPFYLLGRLVLGAMAGTATIWALYVVAKRVASRSVGLLAAGLLAVCFLHVRDSHYIYTDIPLCLALVMALWSMLRVAQKGLLSDYALAGAMVGLCTSVKYNAALVGVAYVVAHCCRNISWKDKLLSVSFWGGVLCCFGVFILTNPFALLDFPFFLQSFSRQAHAQSFVGWTHHITYSLAAATGWPAILLAIFGIALSLKAKNRKAWILLGFIMPFYLGITFMGQVHDRYVLPLIPFLLLFAAMAIENFLGKIPYSRGLRYAAMVLVAGLLFVPALAKSAYSDWLFLQSDSRTLAKDWILSHIPPGTKVAMDHTFFTPKLLPTVEQLRQKRDEVSQNSLAQNRLDRLIYLARPDEKRYELYFLSDEAASDEGFVFSKPRLPYDFDQCLKEGIDVVVSHGSGLQTGHATFFKQAHQQAVFVLRFSPYRDGVREESLEPDVRTGGPSLWRELFARSSNGEPITIYWLR